MFVVVALLLVFAARALPLALTPTSAPLPASTFQGGDGNQDDPAGDVSSPPDGVSDIDWQGLRAARRVHHGADPEPDSAFTGASKENEPGAWGLTTGTIPNKANVTNVWSAVDQPAANTFLYMAFTRETTTGDTHLAFELNRDRRLWNNGQRIPCRRTGDLVVAYDVGTNAEASVRLQQWTGTAADARTGCARAAAASPPPPTSSPIRTSRAA